MSDLAGWKLRGPVRSLRNEHAEWDPGENAWQAPRGVSIVTFRRDGQASESEFHNPDGSIARRARVYTDEGRLVEEQHWRDEGPRGRVIYSYDALGRLTATEDVAPDGTRRTAQACRYDEAGRKTRVTFLSRGDDGVPISYGVEGTELSYSVPEAVTLTVTYDDRDLPAEARFDDANGAAVRRIVFSRDGEGRLLTEVVCFSGANPFPMPPLDARLTAELQMAFQDQIFCSTTYAYDTKGRRLQRTMSIGTLSDERTTFEYGDREDPIAEISSSHSRRVDVDDDGVVHATEEPSVQHRSRYDYRYDAHGNWTERIGSYQIGSQQEFVRSNVERRTITYYGP